MRVRRTIQLRRCTLCNKTGHNRAKCILNLSVNKVKKSAKISVKKELLNTKKDTTKPGKLVLINNKVTRHSPHIIDLKFSKNKAGDIWQTVQAFREQAVVGEERRVVDFGSLIKAHRLANANAIISVKESGGKAGSGRMKEWKIKNEKSILPNSNRNAGGKQDDILNISIVKIKRCFVNAKHWALRVTAEAKSNISIFLSFNFRLNYRRQAYIALVLLIIASLPFPAIGYYNNLKNDGARIIEASANAFLSLQSSTVAAIQANIDQAQFDLNSALVSFGEANSIVDKEYKVLQYVVKFLPVVGRQVDSREHLLTAGHHLALGNTYLIKGAREVENSQDLFLTDKIKIFTNHLRSAIPQYREALLDLGSVDEKTIPVEYQGSFRDFKLLFASFIDDMNDLVELSYSLDLLFGSEQLKRYLLVFQNNNELRPTGGFMGSFAIVDVQKGKVLNFDIPGGGTYDLQGQLDVYVKPPLPLQLANARWEFQDANWFPDFPASARKIEWFFEHGRGVTVDGVIAINASVLERLLLVLGPVVNEEYDLMITSDNAITNLQQEVEIDYNKKENQPKKILSDFAGQFLQRMSALSTADAIRLATELNEAIQEKEIQVYFNDQAIENKMASFGWTGEVLPNAENQDYLYLVNANIQGQKSDAVIEQKIEHQAVVQADGTILDTVVINRKHNGKKGENFYGVNNVDYIRVYVPQGSELVEAGGFNYPAEDAFYTPESWYKEDSDLLSNEQEIMIDTKTGTRVTSEFGKTAFGNWMMVEPGQTSQVYFTYKLPFKLFALGESNQVPEWKKWTVALAGAAKNTSRYSLLVQKQSGIDSDFTSQVIYPDGWSPVWQENNDLRLAANGAEYSCVLQRDYVYGVVMENN